MAEGKDQYGNYRHATKYGDTCPNCIYRDLDLNMVPCKICEYPNYYPKEDNQNDELQP